MSVYMCSLWLGTLLRCGYDKVVTSTLMLLLVGCGHKCRSPISVILCINPVLPHAGHARQVFRVIWYFSGCCGLAVGGRSRNSGLWVAVFVQYLICRRRGLGGRDVIGFVLPVARRPCARLRCIRGFWFGSIVYFPVVVFPICCAVKARQDLKLTQKKYEMNVAILKYT